jgi:hypothetical protein
MTTTKRTRKAPTKVATVTVTRPEPTLKVSDYMTDIKARWAVHQFEWNAFVKDVKKGYDFILPFYKKSIDYSVNLYRRFRSQPAQ